MIPGRRLIPNRKYALGLSTSVRDNLSFDIILALLVNLYWQRRWLPFVFLLDLRAKLVIVTQKMFWVVDTTVVPSRFWSNQTIRKTSSRRSWIDICPIFEFLEPIFSKLWEETKMCTRYSKWAIRRKMVFETHFQAHECRFLSSHLSPCVPGCRNGITCKHELINGIRSRKMIFLLVFQARSWRRNEEWWQHSFYNFIHKNI